MWLVSLKDNLVGLIPPMSTRNPVIRPDVHHALRAKICLNTCRWLKASTSNYLNQEAQAGYDNEHTLPHRRLIIYLNVTTLQMFNRNEKQPVTSLSRYPSYFDLKISDINRTTVHYAGVHSLRRHLGASRHCRLQYLAPPRWTYYKVQGQNMTSIYMDRQNESLHAIYSIWESWIKGKYTLAALELDAVGSKFEINVSTASQG
ncbi:hypothetical protein BDW74DRAFT_143499 [Aspergillus multicolor]|uniref:uncharacterized protein n=1 Tax=Aspergillus multicolor TaxID=41759 RepID=UPI003CCCC544